MTKKTLNGNGVDCKYTKAANSDVDPVYPDKSERTCWQKCSLGGCIVGLFLVISGIVSAFFIKSVVNSKIVDNLVLFEGGQMFDGWRKPPVNPVMKVYFFNLTNKDAFLGGSEKARVEKIGPYVYTEIIEKVDTMFDEAEERVTFSDKKHYFFSPGLSSGSEDDLLLMPNIPMFGAFRKMDNSRFAISIFESLLNSYDGIDKEPFLRLSVRQFLWGYESILMTINKMKTCNENKKKKETDQKLWSDFDDDFFASEEETDDFFKDDNNEPDKKKTDLKKQVEEDECDMTNNPAKFGYFLGFNGTIRGRRTVMTGKTDIQDKGRMVAVGEQTRLGNWSREECSELTGRDPGTLAIGLDKNTPLELYFPNMCRPLVFRYRRSLEIADIPAWRFSPSDDTFHSPADNPDNSCYCHDRVCLPSGVFDIGVGCKAGSPVYMSWPHFLHGDPVLRQSLEGVEAPQRDRDEFYFDIEPIWGTTLAAHAAFQFNVLVSRNGYHGFDNIQQKVMLPFLMLEEGVQGPNEAVLAKMNLLMKIGENVKNLVFLILVAVGFLCMIPEIVIWSKSCCCSTSSDKPQTKLSSLKT